MSFLGTTRRDAVEDFDDYDPTPYSGGYDISFTYGRPLPPSEDRCHPLSSSGQVDYNPPSYSSGFDMASFVADYGRKGDCYGILPPGFKIQRPSEANTTNPSYGRVGSGEHASEYGSSYGGHSRPQEYGSGYGGRQQPQEYGSEYSSLSKPQYGSGLARQEESYGGSGYRKGEEEGYGRQGYGGSEPIYNKPIYYGGESGEEPGRPNYGIDPDEERKYHHQKHHHHHHHHHHDYE